MIEPGSPEELAVCLAEAATPRHSIHIGGNFTKDRWIGPAVDADVTISTRRMNRILLYEPADLTVSVEAGIRYAELNKVLAGHGQMIPLDPPWAEMATIGGVLAANSSGPRRRLYGTARDMVIGMTFATLEGKLIQTGGMVVKNVAGLDMGKLLIGSFGTLAAIAVANFRVHPVPAGTRTFVWRFDRVVDAIAARDGVLKSQLQPAAIDLLKEDGEYRLLVQAGGSPAVLDRYSRELAGARVVEGSEEEEIWRRIREFIPENGVVLEIPCKLTAMGSLLESAPGPAVARAGSGVVYVAQASGLLGKPEACPTSQKIKAMMDPYGLLNRSR
ncbi:MAG: FAD-binding oxidoreductase [Bryobacteraceae bacterium]